MQAEESLLFGFHQVQGPFTEVFLYPPLFVLAKQEPNLVMYVIKRRTADFGIETKSFQE